MTMPSTTRDGKSLTSPVLVCAQQVCRAIRRVDAAFTLHGLQRFHAQPRPHVSVCAPATMGWAPSREPVKEGLAVAVADTASEDAEYMNVFYCCKCAIAGICSHLCACAVPPYSLLSCILPSS